MHCPKCGHKQASEEIRYCSRCGFSLAGVALVVANDGDLPTVSASTAMSKRKRGVMQGIFIFLLSFLIVPVITIISIVINAEPIAVILSVILLTMGGLLRIAYALMFESPEAGTRPQIESAGSESALPGVSVTRDKALTGSAAMPASVYSPPSTGRWRDTNDLEPRPGSIVENTTRHLEKDQPDQ